jgi:alpha/beta superfamily hydrolase
MVKKVVFLSEDYELEGLFNKTTEEKGVVITHPHPLYGGDMYNMVVESIAHVYHLKAYSTLKLNFRGVGNSQGSYSDGIGEQRDVLAAISYLAETGIKRIDLAGYSFGAWVNAHAGRQEVPVENTIMISPPVGFMDFLPDLEMDNLKLVVTGSEDNIAPVDLIRKLLPTWNPEARFEVIEGADHFYGGYIKSLEFVLSAFL